MKFLIRYLALVHKWITNTIGAIISSALLAIVDFQSGGNLKTILFIVLSFIIGIDFLVGPILYILIFYVWSKDKSLREGLSDWYHESDDDI